MSKHTHTQQYHHHHHHHHHRRRRRHRHRHYNNTNRRRRHHRHHRPHVPWSKNCMCRHLLYTWHLFNGYINPDEWIDDDSPLGG